MHLHFPTDRLLAVVAHPDDAELLCAGTLARARADGAAVAVCVLCRGDKGQPAESLRDLAAMRKREMQAAVRLLGAELFTLNQPDGTLADSVPLRGRLVEVYRRFRPTLVLAHAPEDYHPDHRAAGSLAEAASWFCASRGHKTRSEPLAAPPALWWMDTLDMNGFAPGFFIEVSMYVSLKEQMLACHRSQLARSGDRDLGSLVELLRLRSRARGRQAGVEAAEAFRWHLAFHRARAW